MFYKYFYSMAACVMSGESVVLETVVMILWSFLPACVYVFCRKSVATISVNTPHYVGWHLMSHIILVILL